MTEPARSRNSDSDHLEAIDQRELTAEGAVTAAVGAVDPSPRSSASGVQLSDPIAAANQYLGVR